MGNKLTPQKITLAANTLTRLDSIIKRGQMVILNKTGAVLGLTSKSTESAFANCYPVDADVEFVDVSKGPMFGWSVAGGDVWVWETEA